MLALSASADYDSLYACARACAYIHTHNTWYAVPGIQVYYTMYYEYCTRYDVRVQYTCSIYCSISVFTIIILPIPGPNSHTCSKLESTGTVTYPASSIESVHGCYI